MAIGPDHIPEMLPIAGIRLGSTGAGIKYENHLDLTLIEIQPGAACTGVFTRNAFCAAPVTVARQHLQNSAPRYLLINSGNANAGLGQPGLDDAHKCCEALAKHADCGADQVLPFSTGVIGERLPADKIAAALPQLHSQLSNSSWAEAARAIMTTDTRPKGFSETVQIDGHPITITGISKGAGMIKPDMATMLAFIATDADIEPAVLNSMLLTAANRSFNRITIDGDTSTNDACMLIASGQTELATISDSRSASAVQFQQLLDRACESLAVAIVQDGEGATKLVEVIVEQAKSSSEALTVGYTVAESPLVKTAIFASDPNWGRILAAVGRTGVSDLDVNGISIYLDDVCIVEKGGRSESYREKQGAAVMQQESFTIVIRLGRGKCAEKLWTTDLSYDYIRINAEYRS
ncbi:MAG: bifunctional glutamate N-acetyltransferase/amino-acid acetyltransferase ArgJ [Pseudomonadales bacterium]|nr:bifunctional glutamate N-acetyltransferase/amino-acid acetyltransferase ArgJ [Pseudomonadales bacterium]